MKVLILVSFAFAASSASLIHGPWVQQHSLVHGISTVDANGLPFDTPEVAAAKIQHHHDFAVAAQRNGVVAAPVSIYASGYSHPVIGVNGETLEVQAAKIQHLAAHAAARSGLVGVAPVAASLYAHQAAVIGPNGTPLETPEVQAAKAHHLAAHAEANARSGHIIAPAAVGIYGASYAHQAAVIGPNGTPLETPEVQAAKANHLAAHAEANARSGHIITPAAAGIYGASYAHVPAIGVNGVPIDTPEVQHAKAAHLAAHVDAKVRSAHVAAAPIVGLGLSHVAHVGINGAPIETPEVQLAKAAHLAAHAEVAHRAVLAPAHNEWQW